MLRGTAEFRFPIRNKVQGVVFYDIGYAWDKRDQHAFDLGLMEYGYGAGLRINSPLGPIKLDWGKGKQRSRFHFSFGEYDDLIPAMFELIRLGKEDAFFKYSDLSEAIFGAVQEGMDEDILSEYMNDILQAYFGNDAQAYQNILDKMANVDEEYKLPYD